MICLGGIAGTGIVGSGLSWSVFAPCAAFGTDLAGPEGRFVGAKDTFGRGLHIPCATKVERKSSASPPESRGELDRRRGRRGYGEDADDIADKDGKWAEAAGCCFPRETMTSESRLSLSESRLLRCASS